ncbi:hypothetical protein CBS101457_003547 [Exobasidium rhododendri]|nr:hypothetical protein CBS101457_003547 [Exobasidium rhododendri]
MANTPPPPHPAPLPNDGNASNNQGGIDRDVNSILANLNHEQLASIVAAARASEGHSNGDNGSFGGVDASTILAALPPGLGQAASALTSFASSFKRSGTIDHEDGQEGVEGEHQHDQNDEDVKKEGEALEGQYEHHDPEGALGGHDGGDDYRNTAAAIAAMESLAAQTSLELQDQGLDLQGKSSGRNKKDTGPDAERARKDNHKEVERKRREQISNGISELAAIVPGCDAKGVNKTAVINAAVRYIQELKNNEASNIEKWTLEKLLMDQAMNDLNQHLEANRKEVARLRAQLGIEGEPEEMSYHHADHELTEENQHEGVLQGDEESANLDPDLKTASREGAAASALSEVAAVAAAAAAAAAAAVAEEEGVTEASTAMEEPTVEADVAGEAEIEAEEEVEKKTEVSTRGRSRGAEAQPREETGRSKRSRHA